MYSTAYRTVDVNGLSVFYREAGPLDAPAVLLLHGFPSSSRMWQPLLDRLADRFRLVAPDYPGFGGHQVGIDEVRELLTAAAKTLNYETWSAENLVTGFDDTFGFTVELERLTRHIHGETEEMRLRATSVYRREDGAWKVIHRHGDSLMTVEIDPEGRR